MSILKKIATILTIQEHRLFFLAVTGLSILVLTYAFFVEYVLGFEPCNLCLYQRIPYFLLAIFGMSGFIIQNNKYFLIIFAIIFLFATLLAGYHTGIESNIFTPSTTCNSGVNIPNNISAEEFRDMMYNSPIASCTRPAYKIFGISMTKWNLALNIFLLLCTIFAIQHKRLYKNA